MKNKVPMCKLNSSDMQHDEQTSVCTMRLIAVVCSMAKQVTTYKIDRSSMQNDWSSNCMYKIDSSSMQHDEPLPVSTKSVVCCFTK